MTATRAVTIDCRLDARDERRLADDALDGLTRPLKEIPPKHFYDARGSELFERICALPEYYPTRTELEILGRVAGELVGAVAPVELVELGSGAATKARILIAGSEIASYVPFDVSEAAVRAAADELLAEFAALRIHGVVGDFERHLDAIPGPPPNGARLVALLGGTLGNFPPGTRRRLLRDLAGLLRPGVDALLLGAGLVCDPAGIEAAYDDAAGVTAEFNRNLLHVVNRELRADFVPDDFAHVAFFDREREWIEMRLRARRRCTVRVADLGLDVVFAAGEELRTEISAKFTRAGLEGDLNAAGLRLEGWHADPAGRFALVRAGRASTVGDV